MQSAAVRRQPDFSAGRRGRARQRLRALCGRKTSKRGGYNYVRMPPLQPELPEDPLVAPETRQNVGEAGHSAQPAERIGVQENMAAVALQSGLLGPAADLLPCGDAAVLPVLPSDSCETPELGSGLAAEQRLAAMARNDFSGLADAQVMLELKAGNMDAFDVLLAKYRKPMVHFMFRMVHNQAVAEELAQDVFLRVYRARETYRAEAQFSTWLYRIATNLAVNYARDTRYERTAAAVYLDEVDAETGTAPDLADDAPSAEAELLQKERMEAIRRHVMALPERQRTAVLMHKYQGMDYRQIGEVLKLSESATKSLLFRAYQTLREKLKEFL